MNTEINTDLNQLINQSINQSKTVGGTLQFLVFHVIMVINYFFLILIYLRSIVKRVFLTHINHPRHLIPDELH